MDLVMYGLSIVLGLLILVFLVVIHELGHGVVARRNGVVVEEFGIGFPPFARGKKIKKSILGRDVMYSLNWLPIVGFVKLQGEFDSADKKGDYGAATFWQKTKIILAGVAVNWLFAALLFTILALIGMPRVIANQFVVSSDLAVSKADVSIDSVVDGLPAQMSGLRAGDTINRISIKTACPAGVTDPCRGPGADEVDAIIALTKQYPGGTFIVDYVRDGNAKTLFLTNRTTAQAQDKKGYLGVAFSQASPTTYRSTWSAPIVGVGLTGQLSWETLKGLGGLFAKLGTGLFGLLNLDPSARQAASAELGDAGQGVAGPIGIIGTILPNAVRSGLMPILLITAFISMTLAIMNILPIPALDGGRWYTMALFRAIKKPLTKEIEEKINSVGMMIVFGLIVLATVADVAKIF